jgi:hypothetical protein
MSFVNLTDKGLLVIQSDTEPVDLREAIAGKRFNRLHLYGKPANLQVLESLTQLVELHLQSTGHVDLSALRGLTRLQDLNYISGSLKTVDLAFAAKKLKRLALGRQKSLKDLSPIAACVNLEALRLSHLPNVRTYVSLKAFKRLKTLELINLGTWPTLKDLAGAAALASLVLDRTRIVDGQWKVLPRLAKLRFIGGMRDAFGKTAVAEFQKQRPDVEVVG